MPENKHEPTAEEEREQIRFEIMICGFAAVKRFAQLDNRTAGYMPCPLCGQRVRFSIAANNGHMTAKCSRDGCINLME